MACHARMADALPQPFQEVAAGRKCAQKWRKLPPAPISRLYQDKGVVVRAVFVDCSHCAVPFLPFSRCKTRASSGEVRATSIADHAPNIKQTDFWASAPSNTRRLKSPPGVCRQETRAAGWALP